jgi:hypothetical protein
MYVGGRSFGLKIRLVEPIAPYSVDAYVGVAEHGRDEVGGHEDDD